MDGIASTTPPAWIHRIGRRPIVRIFGDCPPGDRERATYSDQLRPRKKLLEHNLGRILEIIELTPWVSDALRARQRLE